VKVLPYTIARRRSIEEWKKSNIVLKSFDKRTSRDFLIIDHNFKSGF